MKNSQIPPLATEILDHISTSLYSFKPTSRIKSNTTILNKPLVFSRLLQENPWEKAALAEIYSKKILPSAAVTTPKGRHAGQASTGSNKQPGRSVFIESGSTCAYVSEVLRRSIGANPSGLKRLSTNNLLTAWRFLKSEKGPPLPAPYLTPGHLESKYYGIFPFQSTTGSDPIKERREYAQLRLLIAESDLLLLAASRLSLRHGPLVGSRENGIFKNACYNACVSAIDEPCGKELHLFVTVQKLVAHHSGNSKRVRNPGRAQNDSHGFHSFREELEKVHQGQCYPVFDLQIEQDRTPSAFSSDLLPEHCQRLRDGTHAVEMGGGRIRICSTWGEIIAKAGMTVKIFVAGRSHGAIDHRQWIQNEVTDATTYFQELGEPIGITCKDVGTTTLSSNRFFLCSITMQKTAAA